MQTQPTITLFGTVSNSATSRISKNGHEYTAFGVSIIPDRNQRDFHYNVVAFGKQGHFARALQIGTRIKLVVQAQSQPDNIASIPLLTATFVRPVHPVARVVLALNQLFCFKVPLISSSPLAGLLSIRRLSRNRAMT